MSIQLVEVTIPFANITELDVSIGTTISSGGGGSNGNASSLTTGVVAIGVGGTGATTAPDASTNLGLGATANVTFASVTAPRLIGKSNGLELFCKAGLAINAGQVVYVTGASGNNIIIGLAQANAESTSSKTIGISESTLANNATGYVITEGLMTVSISSATAVEGDPIWLSPTTAGGMIFGIANKPSSPNHMVYLGVVTRKTGNTVIEIYVKVQNGSELDELSDVAITSLATGHALMRGNTSWVNRSLVSADISDASAGGNGAGDDGKLVKFGANSLRTGVGGGITTAAADSGNNGGYISTSLNGWISTSESGFIQTDNGGNISTSGGGNIETGFNGSIQTGFEGYIRTGEYAPISTYGGGSIITGNGSISTGNGSFTTGEGNLTGGFGTGTIAITANETFTGTCAFNSITVGGSTDGAVGRQLFGAANTTSALTALGYVTKEKTGNGTAVINSVTRIADNHLTGWSLDANSTYEVTGSLWCFADTGGMRVTIEFSQSLDSRYADTAAGFGTASAPDAGVNAAISKLSGVNELLILDRTNPIDSECATIFVRFRTGTSAPTAQFKYAQRTATNNLGSFLLTSSIVSIRKV